MNMTDELERLSKLHKDGTLSEEEFAKAKSRLLRQENENEPVKRDSSLDETANRFLSVQFVMITLGVILFLALLFGVMLPRGHFHHYFFRW